MREQHTDIHTYIQTDRHTYIHTDRQTEANYYIDNKKNNSYKVNSNKQPKKSRSKLYTKVIPIEVHLKSHRIYTAVKIKKAVYDFFLEPRKSRKTD